MKTQAENSKNRKKSVIENFADLTGEISNTFRFLAETGCRGFNCSKESIETVKKWGNSFFLPETLPEIRMSLNDCRRCKLSRGRKNIVFGEGDPHAKLVFIGEAPGYDEDQKGHPFVGAAGRLLTKIIQSMNLTRDKVYICNIIKCRPPGNRNPEPDEIETCMPFLSRQLLVIKPDFICTLGAIAGQTILKTKAPVSKLRGNFYDYNGIKVMPTYHPAYLLRNPDKKRDVWDDMKKLMKEYKY